MIRAGFAKTTITPKTGLLMGGYRLRREVAAGTHDDLYGACAVISDGLVDFVLVALDLLCLPHNVVDAVRAGIHSKTNIAPKYILIACTHTHSGPSTLELSGQSDANDDYLDILPDIISDLVTTAQRSMCQTQISILQMNIPDLAFNRRIKLKDGTNAININKIDPGDIQSLGITDPCVTTLFFESDSRTIGAIINFNLHPTVLGEKNYLYSRDYSGYLIDYLQGNLPGQPVGLFFNGAFGDINQIKVPGEWISTFQEAQRIGETIAGHICKHHPDRISLKSYSLAATGKNIIIPRRSAVSVDQTYPTVDIQPNRHRPGDIHFSPEKNQLFLQEAEWLTEATADRVQLQLFQIGEVEIVALPGEIFVEFGLAIKARSRSPYSLVFGNANGYIGYVPTKSSFYEGGYETRLSRTSRLVPQAGEFILSGIDELRISI